MPACGSSLVIKSTQPRAAKRRCVSSKVELGAAVRETAEGIGPSTLRAAQEPEMSPVSHTALNDGPVVKNQQVATTGAPDPWTPGETLQRIKSLLFPALPSVG